MTDTGDDSDLHVCLDCIPGEHLRDALIGGSSAVHCKYCGKSSTGVSVDALTKAMRERLDLCFTPGDPVRDPSGCPLSEQSGDSLDNILQDRFGFGCEVAADISRMLIDGDDRGYELEFRDGENYVWLDPYLRPTDTSNWDWFVDHIKHTSRYFDVQQLSMLETTLGEPDSPEAANLPVYLLKPNDSKSCVFRARRVKSNADIERFCKNAATELGAPPPAFATAGRMNPQGISVFYGALLQKVAVSELRPSVGGRVVVGKFIPTRTLKLLDLPKLENLDIPLPDSIFAPDFEQLRDRQGLLEGFHSQITRPIQPHDEALDYVPTQVVAQYVANVLKFDGIRYTSAQNGDDSRSSRNDNLNVVIFRDCVCSPSQPFTSLCLDPDSVEAVTITAINYKHSIASLSTTPPYGWRYGPDDESDGV